MTREHLCVSKLYALLGMAFGVFWGSRYGFPGGMGGGATGLVLGFLAGALFFFAVDLVSGIAAGLVKKNPRIGLPVFGAWLVLAVLASTYPWLLLYRIILHKIWGTR